MRRVLCLLILSMAVFSAVAQRGQDFASRFMQQCHKDSVECITISPKMMEQMASMGGDYCNDTLMQAISKLKGVRILQANVNGNSYYQRAEALLKKNAHRFNYVKNYRTDRFTGVFYNRQARNGKVVELVMAGETLKGNKFVLINLTGDIDEEFVEILLKMFGQHTQADT